MAAEIPRAAFLLPVQDVVTSVGTDLDRGLSSARVAQLQEQYPPNELDIGGAIPWYTIFLRQIFNAMILVLFFALALSFGVGDYIEGGVLTAVIILNVTIGFKQEYGAEKKMDALRALSSPSAMVLRDGKTQVIANAGVVPGDIVILKMGDTIPADVRLFDCMNLAVDEQSLTGESVQAHKISEHLEDEELGIGDRLNIAYGTTTVQKGRGRGIVIATGMQTEVGKIASSTGKKKRKAGRSLNYKKYGKRQPVVGLAKRTYDFFGKFLGLTEGTPLQIKLAKLAYMLFGCAILLAVIVFAVHRFAITNEVVIYAISTGIAIIPESLVAVLTITMVVATTVMRKMNVVVRDLSALEALGSVTNICSDKTGTLTQGAMIVKKVWVPSDMIYTVQDSKDPNDPTVGRVTSRKAQVEAEDETPKRDYDQERSVSAIRFDAPQEKLNPPKSKPAEQEVVLDEELRAFLLSAALCNLATVRKETEVNADARQWKTVGEPTEIALQVFAHRFDRGKRTVDSEGWKQVAEFPFDSTIKRMSVIYDGPGLNHSLVLTKGAVERIIDLCSKVGLGEHQEAMTDDMKEKIMKQMNELASQGQRVLAIASRPWDGKFDKSASDQNEEHFRSLVEQDLTLLGLAGIYDPPRRETAYAIAECANAGIKVHMLTGDHPATAEAIAEEVGIIPRDLGTLPKDVTGNFIMKASDFDKMTDDQIDAMPELPLVIARCAPETKTRMIEALRRRDRFMAMTGDGVNDAPSLSRADVGIAMGSGSDVAKSAAKIVLTDDKFNSIVTAIKQGRRMFDNIQKFILHLLSSNVGEVILLIAGLAFRDEAGYSVFPISPLQILWINMLTSSFPAFGLGREPASQNVMRRSPHDRRRGVFTNQIMVDMTVYGAIMGLLCLMTFGVIVYGANNGNLGDDCNRKFSSPCEPVFRARAAIFVELTWIILISAWEFKDLRRSMFNFATRPLQRRGGAHGHKQHAHQEDKEDEQFQDENDGSTKEYPRYLPRVFVDLWANRFLFWAVVIGALSVIPVVYIPYVNEEVFKHTSISWEWGLAVGSVVLYVLGVELWKLTKRKTGWLEDKSVEHTSFSQGAVPEAGGYGFGRKFVRSLSIGSGISWKSLGRSRTGETGASSGPN